MRFLDVTNIENQVIDAGGAHGLGRSVRNIGDSV
jgi:hypothetical protein